MGMSTHVVAIRPADERWHQMKAVYDACAAADLDIPDEVVDYFGGEEPDPKGVVLDLYRSQAVQDWSDKDSVGLEVTLTKLPPDVQILRFFNSW